VEGLNLDAWGRKQAETKRRAAEDAIRARIPETWAWLLVPAQDDPRDASVEWSEFRLGGGEPLAVRAAKKLVAKGALTERLGGTVLRSALDRIPLWRDVWSDNSKDAVSLRQLADDFALYLYLPRITGKLVILGATREDLLNPNWTTVVFPRYGRELDKSACS